MDPQNLYKMVCFDLQIEICDGVLMLIICIVSFLPDIDIEV